VGGAGGLRNGSKMAKDNPTRSRLRWFSRIDVLTAFRIVGQEVRAKCRRYVREGITLAQASELARRIKDQRELVRQLAGRRNIKHARRLMRLNRRLQRRLLGIVERGGVNKDVLVFK
jgi:hypothetical protein